MLLSPAPATISATTPTAAILWWRLSISAAAHLTWLALLTISASKILLRWLGSLNLALEVLGWDILTLLHLGRTSDPLLILRTVGNLARRLTLGLVSRPRYRRHLSVCLSPWLAGSGCNPMRGVRSLCGPARSRHGHLA